MSEAKEEKMEVDDDKYSIVKEGAATVLFPKGNNVFYNPVQEFNRDLTIVVIAAFANKWREEEEEGGGEELGKMRRRKIKWLRKGKREKKAFRILEALAATGLRSVRFSLEIPLFLRPSPPSPPLPPPLRIVANDLDPSAVRLMRRNAELNETTTTMKTTCDDAVSLMMAAARGRKKGRKRSMEEEEGKEKRRRKNGEREDDIDDEEYVEIRDDDDVENEDEVFQTIDLDPYGTAAPFLDSAVQAIEDGGLLCVTCTDAAVLCGQTPETCFTKYGSISLRAKFCHEQAIRVVLHSLSSHASRHSKYIRPLLSLSIDFYIRVFVRVHVGQAQAKLAYTKSAMIFNCSGCGSHRLQPLGLVERNGNSVKYLSSPLFAGASDKCEHCGHRVHIGGPVWSDPLHDLAFVARAKELATSPSTPTLKTEDRIVGMLTLVEEELEDVPLYYVLDEGICGALHCFTPPAAKFRSALLNAGFRVSLSHAAESSIKTDADARFLWDLMRVWVKDSPVNPRRLTEGSVAQRILSVEPSSTIDFALHPDATSPSQIQGLKRFPLNPASNWGPKPRARPGTNEHGEKSEMKKKNKKRKADPNSQANLKKFACKRFAAGDCRFGEDCVYSHRSGGESAEDGGAAVATAVSDVAANVMDTGAASVESTGSSHDL